MIDQAPPEWHDPQPGRHYGDAYAVKLTVPIDVATAMAYRSFWRGFAAATVLAIIAGLLQPIIWLML